MQADILIKDADAIIFLVVKEKRHVRKRKNNKC